MSEKLLELKNITMKFGGVTALSEVNLHVSKGEIAALIGPNGAGKTTVFNVVTGVYPVTSGDILFNGENLKGKKRHHIVKAGLARTFQNVRLFGDMTTLENVITATDVHKKSGLLGALFAVIVILLFLRNWRATLITAIALPLSASAGGISRHRPARVASAARQAATTEREFILVKGKGGRERLVPVSDAARAALEAYCRVIEAWVAHFHGVAVKVKALARIDELERELADANNRARQWEDSYDYVLARMNRGVHATRLLRDKVW